MHAPLVWLEVFLPDSLATGIVGARHEAETAVLIHMRLDMTTRDKLLAALDSQGAPHLDLVTHVDQQAGYTGRDVAGGGSARGTRELVGIGRAEGSNSGLEAFLAEDVIALETRRLDEGTVADRTHEVGIIVGNEIQSAQVNNFVIVAFHLQGQKVLDIHIAQDPSLQPGPRSVCRSCWLRSGVWSLKWYAVAREGG